MPTASVGAPPVRERMVVSPISLAVAVSTSGVSTKPQLRDRRGGGFGGGADQRGRRVHREVHARVAARRRRSAP